MEREVVLEDLNEDTIQKFNYLLSFSVVKAAKMDNSLQETTHPHRNESINN